MIERLALGTAQFGLEYGINNRDGKVKKEAVEDILSRAVDLGIDTLDTAAAYGDSENVLGACLHDHRTHYKIVSKYSSALSESPSVAALQSISNLGVDHLYGYLFHSFKDFLSDDGKLWRSFQNLKKKGIVKKIGFSLYYPEEARLLLERQLEFDLVQIPYSLLDRRFETLIPLLKQRCAVEIHVRSVFLQGLVFKKLDALSSYFLEIRVYLEKLHRHSYETGQPVGALCLGFVLTNRFVDRAVIGVESASDLGQNAAYLTDEAILSRIDWKSFDDVSCPIESVLLPFNWPGT